MKWSLELTLPQGSCQKVLIVARTPKQKLKFHEQLEDLTEQNAHMENKCTINFFETLLILFLWIICLFLVYLIIFVTLQGP